MRALAGGRAACAPGREAHDLMGLRSSVTFFSLRWLFISWLYR